jgi:RNA polymerase sigma-70 factor, ECF subfamily
MDLNEPELIEKAKNGDSRAFEELIRLHDRRLLQVCHGIMGNMQDAYDAYQEGIIRAYTHLDSFRSESAFGTWLTRIVINQSLNLKKKLRWRTMVSLDYMNDEGITPPELHDSSSSDELTIRSEMSQEIANSMRKLSDRERSVFVLKHQHGYKLKEIAEMIGCAEGTVKNYLFRATQKVRKALAGYAEVVLEASSER